jgi:hypothetical protein
MTEEALSQVIILLSVRAPKYLYSVFPTHYAHHAYQLAWPRFSFMQNEHCFELELLSHVS